MQLSSANLEVFLAKDRQDIHESQRLRAEIFGSNYYSDDESYRDVDEYDKSCDHLIVRDKEKNLIVGTYRLLPSFKAKEIGFHAEKIFDISNIKKIKDNILELGRSCVHPDYRTNLVINFLWRGIGEYIQKNNIKLLFGCPRLDTSDIKEISKIFFFLKQRFYSSQAFRVEPLPQCSISLIEDVESQSPQKILRELPPLIKGYLKTGALVCGYPAMNKEFGSIVIFMLLDFSSVNPAYKKRFYSI